VSNAADLIKAIAALLWVGLAFTAVLVLRNVVRARGGSLTRLGFGLSGVTMEFAQAKLDEAVRGSSQQDQHAVGQAAKRSVLDRLQRNTELLSRARILWVDDHPENNTALVELLVRFGATVEPSGPTLTPWRFCERADTTWSSPMWLATMRARQQPGGLGTC
jgi:hypothetical protein